MSWDPRRPPEQRGRTAVVTGATAGIGYFIAEQLAGTGARVVLAARSPERADRAMAAIRARVPAASLEFVRLDLASLDSVRIAAAELRALGTLDVVVHNAGLTSVGPARRATTVDGIEVMVGVNAFAPFALTAQLWPALSPTARVIGLGSLTTRLQRADLDDLQLERGRYSLSRAYAFSKHAVHALGFELDRRLRAAGRAQGSLVAHPGFALDTPAPRIAGITDQPRMGAFAERLLTPMVQGKDRGAWPAVRAALDPVAESGQLWGPRYGLKGTPVVVAPAPQSAAPAFGVEVWRQAEAATGVRFEL